MNSRRGVRPIFSGVSVCLTSHASSKVQKIADLSSRGMLATGGPIEPNLRYICGEFENALHYGLRSQDEGLKDSNVLESEGDKCARDFRKYQEQGAASDVVYERAYGL